MEVKDLKTITYKIAEAKASKSKAEGALEQVFDQLKKGFNCSTIEEAQAKLDELKDRIAKDNERLDKVLSEIEEQAKKWGWI